MRGFSSHSPYRTVKTAAAYFALVNSLGAALERTRRLMAHYLAKFTAQGWPEQWDFDLLHDLEQRLQRRLAKAWAAYYDWHYSTYGWVGL